MENQNPDTPTPRYPDTRARRVVQAMNTAQTNDTIAAISTPPGPGGVGMIRITGSGALAIGRRIFTPLKPDPAALDQARRAVVGHVHSPRSSSDPIDQAIWLSFISPNSFTGEDTVEITTHGGPLILREALEAAVAAGARLAEPGEFTRRAFSNGRMDLSQAESVASLIFAATSEARRVMQRQVEGAMGQEAGLLRDRLLEAKVLLESAIDFPEDVDEIQPESLVPAVSNVIERVSSLLGTSKEGIAMVEGLRVVIAGAPNVGKSSLLNALLQEERAIVHEIEGTTRDYIEGRISVKGIPMVVVDTAGIRGSAEPLEDAGIARTRALMKEADLLLMVMDGSRPANTDEMELLESTAHDRRVVAVNKSDLPDHPELNVPHGAVRISALEGAGLDELKDTIHDTHTGSAQTLDGADAVVTSLRQVSALEKVRDGCVRLKKGLEASLEPELLTVDLEESLQGVAELTGEVTVEEVLERIFERFCIGK